MEFNLINFCEFDKYAIKSYCAIHNETESKNLGDITQVKSIDYCDLLTYGFPCQDISVAGLQAGIKEGTRSGLLYEVERLLEQMPIKPKFLIMENVKNLVGAKHKADFDKWLLKLEEMGYITHWEVMNAKYYGIPQNRERVFAISIRKDIYNGFEFPQKQELNQTLQDLLLDEVDEKFYLQDYQIDKIKNSNFIQEKKRIQEKKCCDTLLARDWKDPKCVQVGNLQGGKWDKIHENCRRIYSPNGISPTVHTCGGGNTELKIINNQLIRKLTPQECFRLMGFDDEDFYAAQKYNSNSQLYKQAGNSIVVNVLVEIYKQLQIFYPNDFKKNLSIISLFSGIGAFEKALKNLK